MFSTSPQFSGKNVSKVIRLISKTANSVFFCTFFTYMNTMCTRAQKWAPGSSVHTIFESCGQSTALFSLLSSCFKMESDRAKWSNYVHSHISGTQSVNTTPLCAGTEALVLEHQVWTVPYITLPPTFPNHPVPSSVPKTKRSRGNMLL